VSGGAALLLVALAVIAGCTDGTVRTVQGDYYGYRQVYLHYAASRGPVPALVRGTAFDGMSTRDFAQRVVEQMRNRPLGVGAIEFQTIEPDELETSLYVSLVFNPEPSFDSYDACDLQRADTAGRPTRPGHASRVVAAFCSTERLLSGTVGEATLTGPADPNFGKLIQQVLIDLFPPYDPDTGACDSCP